MTRGGFVLVFALFVITAVELLVVSSLALATHEAVISEVRVRTAVAENTASAALEQFARAWPASNRTRMRIAESTSFPQGDATITVERISWGLYHARARVQGGRAIIERAAIMRTLDAERGMRESNEAMVAAGPVVAPLARLEVAESESCELPFVAERAATAVTVQNRHHALGMPDVRIDSMHAVLPEGYAGAGLRWDEVASIADVYAGSTIQLTPTDSLGASTFPLIYAPGDLRITGGAGQGLLFVNGTLTIDEHVRFAGLIIVRGPVIVHDSVTLLGVLRTHSTQPSLIGTATITYSACACVRALMETPAATRLIKAHRFHIPIF